MNAHSELPWAVAGDLVTTAIGMPITACATPRHAALIVTAVNFYPAAAAILQDQTLSDTEIVGRLRSLQNQAGRT